MPTDLVRLRLVASGVLVLVLAACSPEQPAARTEVAREEAGTPSEAIGGHSDFELVDDYVLEVDGEPSPVASLYASSQTRALLVISQDLPAPVLLWPGSRRVETLQMLKVARKAGGFVEILPDPVIAVHAPFRVEPPDIEFTVEGIEATLAPKPPLLGLRDVDEMIQYSSAYAQRAETYTPSVEAIESLRGSDRSVRVRVFFGSWCPACGQMVPRLMKVERELDDSSPVDVEYYGLPRGFAGEPEAAKYGIDGVPTAVVFEGDAEIGRIKGSEWRSPEETLSNLLGAS